MNFELINLIILVASLMGIAVIVLRKIPVLVGLSEVIPPPKEGFYQKLKERIKTIDPFKKISYELFLQKLLSKIRILTLKTENKTFNWLQKLKEKAQRKKLDNDKYWEEIKKMKDGPR